MCVCVGKERIQKSLYVRNRTVYAEGVWRAVHMCMTTATSLMSVMCDSGSPGDSSRLWRREKTGCPVGLFSARSGMELRRDQSKCLRRPLNLNGDQDWTKESKVNTSILQDMGRCSLHTLEFSTDGVFTVAVRDKNNYEIVKRGVIFFEK